MCNPPAHAELEISPFGNHDVVEALGTPITSGLFVTGNIEWGGGEGSASLAIPLNGPNGKGKAYLRASRKLGEWTLHQLVVRIEDLGLTIDVLGNREVNSNGRSAGFEVDHSNLRYV